MKNLVELYRFIKEQPGTLSFPAEKKEHKFTLFLHLLEDVSQTEATIYRALYPSGDHKPAYRELKRRVHAWLLQQVMTVSKEVEFQQGNPDAHIHLRRNVFLAYLLSRKGYGYTASRIAMAAYKKAKFLYSFDMAVEALKMLRIYYAQEGNVRNVEKCNLLIQRFNRRIQWELMAENQYHLITAELVMQSELSEQTAIAVRKFLKEAARRKFPVNAIRLRLYHTRIMNLFLNHGPDPDPEIQRLKELWEAVEKFMLKNPQVVASANITELSYNLSKIYIYAGAYEKAEKLIRYAVLYLDKKEHANIFLIKQVAFMLLIRQNKIKEAIELAEQLTASDAFIFLDQRTRYLWLLHKFSARFLKDNLRESGRDPMLFSEVHRFFKRDKTGIKITAYIYELLDLVAAKHMEQALHKIDSFRKFITHHFPGGTEKRLEAWLKLMENYSKHFPQPKPNIEKKYLRVLESYQPSYRAFRYEFVPLEMIYRFLTRQI